MPTAKEGLDTIGQRLRWAIENQPAAGRQRGLRMFVRGMERRQPPIRGVSLPSVTAYLRGAVEPSPKFLKEAGTVLRVRPEWLAFGSGAPLEADDIAANALVGMEENHRSVDVRKAMLNALSLPDPAAPLGSDGRLFAVGPWAMIFGTPNGPVPFWVAAVGSVVEQFYAAEWSERRGAPKAGFTKGMSADVCKAMAAPLKALGLDARTAERTELADYIQMMTGPLLVLSRMRERLAAESWIARMKPPRTTRKKSRSHRVKRTK